MTAVVKRLSVRAIGAQGSVTVGVTARLKRGATAKGNYVIAAVDAADAVREADETNNAVTYGPLP